MVINPLSGILMHIRCEDSRLDTGSMTLSHATKFDESERGLLGGISASPSSWTLLLFGKTSLVGAGQTFSGLFWPIRSGRELVDWWIGEPLVLVGT